MTWWANVGAHATHPPAERIHSAAPPGRLSSERSSSSALRQLATSQITAALVSLHTQQRVRAHPLTPRFPQRANAHRVYPQTLLHTLSCSSGGIAPTVACRSWRVLPPLPCCTQATRCPLQIINHPIGVYLRTARSAMRMSSSVLLGTLIGPSPSPSVVSGPQSSLVALHSTSRSSVRPPSPCVLHRRRGLGGGGATCALVDATGCTRDVSRFGAAFPFCAKTCLCCYGTPLARTDSITGL